jgi:hypothetical protein
MTALRCALPLTAFMMIASTVGMAQESRSGRYTMHKADDGFVRLDTETGAVALCKKSDKGWGCEDMTDSRGNGAAASGTPGNEGESAGLARKNAELRAEIKRMEELLDLRGNRGARNDHSFKLPSEKEVDQALDYFERMLKKFQDRLNRLENKDPKPERQL